MKAINLTWTFAAGLGAALVLSWSGPGDGPPAPRPLEDLAEPGGPRAPAARPAETAPSAEGRAARRAARTVAEERGGATTTAGEPPSARAGAPDPADGADAYAAELERMSAGYRNRIFLQAIRDRGHYCEGIVDTQLGQADIAAWRIACGGMNAYLISVETSGALAIEPLYYGAPPGGPLLVPGPRSPRQPFQQVDPE